MSSAGDDGQRSKTVMMVYHSSNLLNAKHQKRTPELYTNEGTNLAAMLTPRPAVLPFFLCLTGLDGREACPFACPFNLVSTSPFGRLALAFFARPFAMTGS